MRINLTTPMTDDKERQQRNKAVLDAIEQYTEERMDDAYGRIHTDGSRSGGQPVLRPCPFCGETPKLQWHSAPECWVECSCGAIGPMGEDTSTDDHIALWNTRQPTQSKVAADSADRIGGAGIVTRGGGGVATQSDADLLEEMRFTYETFCSEGYNDTDYTEDLDFEIEARGWEAAFAVAVAKLRQPTQSDAVQAEIEALRHDLERQMTIANEQVNEVERLREALEAAPLIGRTESVYDFMERQDAWLKGPYRAAMQEQSK